MSKTETKMVMMSIPIDEKSKDRIMKIAARKAEKSHSNPTAIIRDTILSGFGIEGKKPRNYMRSSKAE
ncbi:hypothetical protein [Methanosarcina sp.]|uniref:hypothetical protein n=1 Tax=Methanosarcina sp. TaxID=2213 RepID=UPI002BE35548|nr:hypothetical protein [Methanosarcina sp.]HOW13513.1 hypothetical protein [Methanosarcina sp.]